MNNKYVIVVDYYHWSDEKGEYTLPLILGLEGENRIFVFDDELTDRTKFFDSLAKANDYLKKHNLKESCCFENGRVMEVRLYEPM